jgi:hypothetical protein
MKVFQNKNVYTFIIEHNYKITLYNYIDLKMESYGLGALLNEDVFLTGVN